MVNLQLRMLLLRCEQARQGLAVVVKDAFPPSRDRAIHNRSLCMSLLQVACSLTAVERHDRRVDGRGEWSAENAIAECNTVSRDGGVKGQGPNLIHQGERKYVVGVERQHPWPLDT